MFKGTNVSIRVKDYITKGISQSINVKLLSLRVHCLFQLLFCLSVRANVKYIFQRLPIDATIPVQCTKSF